MAAISPRDPAGIFQTALSELSRTKRAGIIAERERHGMIKEAIKYLGIAASSIARA
jgi:hypothetical protein